VHSRGQDIARAKPADHPVVQSTKFDPVTNMKTANALGIDVPANASRRRDEMIE
jgi:ABC-type uncharacterized transport system substrate-binding protein